MELGIGMSNIESRYERYCKELEALNKKVKRKLQQIEDVQEKLGKTDK
jgi:ABC-type Zn uptake system ZnuABC Zn-binding protein ZnuA